MTVPGIAAPLLVNWTVPVLVPPQGARPLLLVVGVMVADTVTVWPEVMLVALAARMVLVATC